MSFISAREHGARPGSGGPASAQAEVGASLWDGNKFYCVLNLSCVVSQVQSLISPFPPPPFSWEGRGPSRAVATPGAGDDRPGQRPVLHA